MKGIVTKNTECLKFFNLSKIDFVEHCFTSRKGGYSSGSYKSLNMGFSTGDDHETVKKNYGVVAGQVFNSELGDLVLSSQVHKANIARVTEEDRGKGFSENFRYSEIDGLVTDREGLVLATVYADCTPLFFADQEKKVVGVAHAGWRGTVAKIGKKMVEKMQLEYGSVAEDIVVGIGPTIGPCCYEVGQEVYDRFKAEFKDLSMIENTGEKIRLDLWKANQLAIMESGVLKENIELGRLCTRCNSELFYSYRRDKGVTGRMAGMIKLK